MLIKVKGLFKSALNLSSYFKPHANGRNIVGCYMLRPFAHPALLHVVGCCCVLLCKV